jgi:hypothetical protein
MWSPVNNEDRNAGLVGEAFRHRSAE